MDYQANQTVAYQAKQQAAGYQLQGAATPEQTIMSAAHMELDGLTNLALQNNEHLRGLKERLFGPQTEKHSGGPVPKPVPNGSVALLADKVETLKTVLRDQAALVIELQRVG